VIRLAASALATIWLAATLAFFALRVLPGDAVTTQMRESGASAETIAIRRAVLGLDAPVVIQYVRFLGGLARGDLGVSLQDGRQVSEIIVQQFIPTLILTMGALLVSVIFGVLLGAIAALDQQSTSISRFSFLARLILDLSLSVPLYLTGTLAIYFVTVFAIQGLPASGIVLPTLVLGFTGAGAIGQLVRASVSETLGQDFVRTARAKGLSEMQVSLNHVIRAGLLPVITAIALQAGFLLGGVVITESLFVRPGIGRILLNATLRQDYPVVQGIVVFGAIVYILVNFAADLLYRLLDPRV
jgi:peptide/nickel transport system permease protein